MNQSAFFRAKEMRTGLASNTLISDIQNALSVAVKIGSDANDIQ